MSLDMTREQEEALIQQARSRPGSIVGRSIAESLLDRPVQAPSTPPPAQDCDEVTEFMPRVISLAEAGGWEVWHCRNAKFSKAGFLDLELCRPPRLLKIELKSENGVLTSEQKKWLNLYRRCPGIEAFVFWPKDWQAIEVLLA